MKELLLILFLGQTITLLGLFFSRVVRKRKLVSRRRPVRWILRTILFTTVFCLFGTLSVRAQPAPEVVVSTLRLSR